MGHLADHAIERTGDPAVFGRIAIALAGGAGFTGRLADSGYRTLPVATDALAVGWKQVRSQKTRSPSTFPVRE